MALEDIPKEFSLDTEQDVHYAVVQYFAELGFQPTEMPFEKSFSIRLGHSDIEIKSGFQTGKTAPTRVGGRSDILLTRHGTNLAIVEVKRDGLNLTEDDGWQAISYARLLRQMAPFAIVTNGRDTQVYDTLGDSTELSDLLVDNATNSLWHKNGQRLASINQDLRSYAAQKLISINPDTLELFCRRQTELGMNDLVGSIGNNRIYIPDVYVARSALKQQFEQWLESEFQCFGLVGESGTGKTNFMCATAPQLHDDYLVLFYRAINLHSGFLEAIRADFEWGFRQNRTVQYLVNRLVEIASLQDKEVIIFIDALDEYAGNSAQLKAELHEFVAQIVGLPIRICVSCKKFDWERYVIDSAQSFNHFALNTYPQETSVSKPRGEKPSLSDVGYHLSDFSAEEFAVVYEKYRHAYQLPSGELNETVRVQCQIPLNLRLFSEVYRDSDGALPIDISTKEMFKLFLERKLSNIKNKHTARHILAFIANNLVTKNNRHVLLDNLGAELSSIQNLDTTLDDLIRYGLLATQTSEYGLTSILLPFEKLRSYLFTVFHRCWPEREPEEVIKDIVALMETPQQLAMEAIEFYLGEIDRGETPLLTILSEKNLDVFLSCTNEIFSRNTLNPSIRHLSLNERSKSYWKRLEQFALSYSRIRLSHFQQLASRIPPYTSGGTGVWTSEDGSIVQLRQTNEQYPQPILPVPGEYVRLLLNGKVTEEFFKQIGYPAGPRYLMGMTELERQLPQKVSWKQIVEEVGKLLENGLLNEVGSPILLEERIREVLFNEPSIWDGNSPDRMRCYERIGLSTPEEAHTVALSRLRQKVHSQFLETTKVLQSLDENTATQERFWVEQLRYMFLLRYWLTALLDRQEYLTNPIWSVDELFEPIRDPTQVVRVFEPLVPHIFGSYRSMVENNFSSWTGRLELYRHLEMDSPIMVEITRNPYEGGFSSDFFEIRYIILPNGEHSLHGKVFWAEGTDSLAHVPLSIEFPGARSVTTSGGKFGSAKWTTTIDNHRLNEVDAIVYCTEFPSRQPITAQVYALLAVELARILDSRSRWYVAGQIPLNCEMLTAALLRSNDPLAIT